jgi:hypothetical protein
MNIEFQAIVRCSGLKSDKVRAELCTKKTEMVVEVEPFDERIDGETLLRVVNICPPKGWYAHVGTAYCPECLKNPLYAGYSRPARTRGAE